MASLGSFYGKTWESERRALTTSERTPSSSVFDFAFGVETAPLSLPAMRFDFKRLRERARTYSGSSKDRKTPQVETLQVGLEKPVANGKPYGVQNGTPDVKPQQSPQSNGLSIESLEKSREELERDMLHVNEVVVPVPPGLVEAVVAAWTLLMHRYQRDAFHSFSWGVSGEELRRVEATQLSLEGLTTVADLLELVQRITHEAPASASGGRTLKFVDGSNDEVRLHGRC